MSNKRGDDMIDSFVTRKGCKISLTPATVDGVKGHMLTLSMIPFGDFRFIEVFIDDERDIIELGKLFRLNAL